MSTLAASRRKSITSANAWPLKSTLARGFLSFSRVRALAWSSSREAGVTVKVTVWARPGGLGLARAESFGSPAGATGASVGVAIVALVVLLSVVPLTASV